MKKIAPELDQLMWMIAENGDTLAVEEFEARHPDLRYELSRRMTMLRQLKSAGKAAHQPAQAPVFRPREARRQAPGRWTIAGVGMLGLAALAAASYTVVSFLEPAPKPIIKPEPSPKIVSVAPPQTTVVTPLTNPPPPQVESPPQQDTTPAYLKPQDVKIDNAPLTAVIKMIAAQGGLEVQIGPGMVDPTIKIEYHGRTTIEMLKDLGRQYAFTPFDQGDGSVLVIPAVDQTNESNPTEKVELLPPKHIQKSPDGEARTTALKPDHRS